MIAVAVVDDQELVRAGFRALLEVEPDMEVAGEAEDGRAAVELARRRRLDVMLMDIRMPGMDGIEAARLIRGAEDPPEVLALTTFDTDDNVFDALEAGVAGFLVKDTPPVQLLQAVRAAAAGGGAISPSVTRRLIDHVVASRLKRSADAVESQPVELLTPREHEVLQLVALGCSNREIAARLHISELTAKTHVSRVLTKLDVDSRLQAAAHAYRTGLVRPRQ